MFSQIEPYLLAFVAIFVAVDALGNVPLFLSLTEGVNKKQRDKIIIDSVTTAAFVAIAFMFVGKLVLRFIGITIPDFQIAGGLLLFVIAVRLLLPDASKSFLATSHDKDVGVFPLGMPLITGPAVLTTTLMMVDANGIIATFVSLILNMFIAWLTLVKSDLLMKLMGVSGLRILSKIMYILLASIGIMMIRKGILSVWVTKTLTG